MEKMKILFINQTFYPDPVATAQQLTDLSSYLAKEEHEVWVLTSQRGYTAPHPCYSAREEYKGVKIVRVWPFALGRKYKLFRVVDSICINLAFLVRLLTLPRFDSVVALTSPPLVGFIAQWVCQFKKSRLVSWVMDMNPDEAIAMGWIKENSLVANLFKWCQRVVVRRSERVIVLDRYMQERLMLLDSRFRGNDKGAIGFRREVQSDQLIVIPPWSHDEDLQAVAHEQNPFRKKHLLEKKFIVMYSGNHSVCHPLDTVLETARLFKDEPQIVFMFIGGGARVKDVADFKLKHDLKNIIQRDYVERSEIKYSLSAADLHLVVMGDNMIGIVHPCKVYGILALGRPFVYIGPEQSHIADLMMEGAVGYSVRHGDVEKMVEVIRRAQEFSQKELEAISQKNRGIAKRFSAGELIPKMAEIILKKKAS